MPKSFLQGGKSIHNVRYKETVVLVRRNKLIEDNQKIPIQIKLDSKIGTFIMKLKKINKK